MVQHPQSIVYIRAVTGHLSSDNTVQACQLAQAHLSQVPYQQAKEDRHCQYDGTHRDSINTIKSDQSRFWQLSSLHRVDVEHGRVACQVELNFI